MTEDVKKFGIETIKKVSKDVIDTIKEFIKDNEDKKISKMEWLAKVDNAIVLGKDFFQYKILASEFIDIDSEEGIELVNYIADQGIGDLKAKKLAIYIIQLIDIEVSAYNDIIKPAIELLKEDAKI
jgi:hypothetical protein